MKLRFILFLFVLISFRSYSTTYYSRVTTGNWGTAATWSTVSCGGVQAAVVPGAGDDVIICSGHTITMNVAVNCTNLTISTGGAATIGNMALTVTGTMLVSGTFTFTSGSGTRTLNIFTLSGGLITATTNNVDFTISTMNLQGGTLGSGTRSLIYNVSGNVNVQSGSTDFGPGTFDIAGDLIIDGSIDFSSTTGAKTFNNVIVNTGGSFTTTGNETFTINGNITNNGGTINTGTANFTLAGTGKSISGTSFVTIGKPLITGSYTNLGLVSCSSNFNVTGSFTQGTNSILQFGGVFTVTTTNFITTAVGNTVEYTGANQIVFPTTYYNLKLSPSTISTIDATINVNGDLTINTGSTTLSATGIINVTGATIINSTFNINNSGTRTLPNLTINSGGTWNYQAIGITNILGNLTMNGGTINGTATGSINVNGDFSQLSGTSTISVCNLSVTGLTSITGTLNFNNITGTKSFNNISVLAGGNWDVAVALPFTVSGNIVNDGTFNGGSGTSTLSGTGKSISGANNLDFSTISVTGTYTNNGTVSISSDLTGAGSWTQGSNSTLNLGNSVTITTLTAASSTNIVNYNGTAAQTIRTNNYSHLMVTKSTGIATFFSGATVSAGDFTIQSGTCAINDVNLSIGTNTNVLGTLEFTSATGTKTFNNVSMQSGSNWNCTAAVPITINGDFNNSGTLTSNTGIYSFAGISKNITGILTITSTNFTGSYTNNNELTTSSLAGSGSLTQAASATLTITGATTLSTLNALTTGNTVIYNSATTQSISGASSFYNLTINNTAGATVSLTVPLNVYGSVNLVKGILSGAGNVLILKSTSAETGRILEIPAGADYSGNITMERYIGSGANGWRFIGSPVTGQTLANWMDNFAMSGFTGSTDPTNGFVSMYTYDETATGTADFGYIAPTNITNSISPGTGYWAYIGPVPLTIDVTGPPVKGNQTYNLSYTNYGDIDNDGWNMFANPYPCTIDWNSANWTKTGIDNSYYVWDNASQQYATYVGGAPIGTFGATRYIGSSQAFWVKANGSASPQIVTRETIKTSTDAAFLRSAPNAQNVSDNWFRLKITGNNYSDEALFVFDDQGTVGYDAGIDALKFYSGVPEVPNICSVGGTNDITINTIPNLNSSLVIPIKTTTGTSNTYTIKIENLSGIPMSSCVMLEDLFTGVITNLKANNTYTFTLSDTTQAPRFLLKLGSKIGKTSVATSCFGSSNGSAVASGSGTGPWTYIWKNSSGTTLRTVNNLMTADTLTNRAAGIYTVNVINGTGPCNNVTDTITITQPSEESVAVSSELVTCYGENDGAIFITANVNSASTLNICNQTGAIIQTVNNFNDSASFINLTAGKYIIKTITECQTIVDTVNLTQPEEIISDFSMSEDTVYVSDFTTIQFTNNSTGALNYMWDFGDNTGIVISQNATHTYGAAGIYNVTLVNVQDSCSDTFVKQITVLDTNATSTKQIISEDGITLIRTNNELAVNVNISKPANIKIDVYNLLGQTVYSHSKNAVSKEKISIDIPFAGSPKMYVISVAAGEKIITKKVIY